MRDLLLFFIVLGVVFFGVGEWRGWFLGVPSQTPVYVYKKHHIANATRRTINLDHLPVKVTGDLQEGDVTVAVFYERPVSYQTGRDPLPEAKVFERSFSSGERVAIDRVFSEGQGIYRVQLEFEDATGLFRVNLPTASQL
ncbi:MAG: hypothetical protein WD273_07185 [Trueperaceae bacterium]